MHFSALSIDLKRFIWPTFDMCGRYYRRSDKQAITEHFRVRNDLTDLVLPDADYNVAPTTMQPVIREARDTKDRELVLMRWGLIPFFSKALSDVKGISTINARAEIHRAHQDVGNVKNNSPELLNSGE